MASEQFSLCWDNFHKNMSSGMNSLLENEDLVDVTLAVQGKCLKAHKMVLSVCSPYFKELFKSNPCQHPIVFMKDVSYEALSDLLQFMYQGEVQVSQENLTTFIKTAEALQIKGLTGDGNGTTEPEPETAQEHPVHHVEGYKPTPRPKKTAPAPIATSPQVKRQRLSVSSTESQPLPPSITKTEPAPTPSTGTSEAPVQFKMEPYDQSQNLVDETGDDNFGDDTLDDNTVDDSEDYSMMEGGVGEEEPQAGTSTDGAGEGQVKCELIWNVDSDDDDDISEVRADEEKIDTFTVLPEKSRRKYEYEYETFKKWMSENYYNSIDDNIIMTYFIAASEKFKSSTLWTKYSMLRSTLYLNDNVDIKKPKLVKFLKKQAVGYTPKEVKTFRRDDIIRFISEAPDEIYLFMKVALIMAVCGACRCEELTNLLVDDIQDKDDLLVVTIPSTRSRVPRTFIVTSVEMGGINVIDLYRKYYSLRTPETKHSRFFVNYIRGKCTVQVVGKNKFARIPCKVAEFLKLPEPSSYTGQSFRKTSASLMVEAGGLL